MDTPSRSEPVRRVGFIGLGALGGAMAARVVAAGWPMVLWARRPAALAPFAATNVEVADTPSALAAAVDLVCVCVWADDDVRAVVDGPDGLLAGCRPGTVIAIHSTVHPITCLEIAERSAPLGVIVLDAPVSGGPPAAKTGALTLALGGDASAIEGCRPVFEAFASSLVDLGHVGAGQLAKLLNNAVLAANLAVADDAFTLGTALGLDADALARFLGEGSGRSFALGVAAQVRASAATREAARRALEKDVERLADASASIPGADVLRAAAACAVDRLSNPPSTWTELKE